MREFRFAAFMADATTPAPRTPWHLWLIGVIYLLWSAAGAFDFVMTETHNAAYVKNFTSAQRDYFYGFPGWVVAAWAVATLGGVFGSLLLLARKCLAVPFFLAAFVAMILTTIYNFGLSDGRKIMGGVGPLVFSCIIVVAGFLVWYYARSMRRRGVLR